MFQQWWMQGNLWLSQAVPAAGKEQGFFEKLFADVRIDQLMSTVIYSLVGLIMFVIAFVVIEKATPFSVRKEIEEDQNTSLGIIIGAVMIGLSIIIAAALK